MCQCNLILDNETITNFMKHLAVKLSGSKWHLALIVMANTDEQSGGGGEGVSLDNSLL